MFSQAGEGKLTNPVNTTSRKFEEELSFIHIEQDSEQIRAILKQFSHLFAIDLSQLKRAKGIYHYIETGDALPVHTKPYRTSAEEKKIIKEEIEKMLEYNIITKSKSSWSSGICLVTKSDNTIRFCIDFRRLNDVTIKEKIPIPIISDIYDALVGNNYFTVLDCKMGYWSIPLHPETKHKTAFTSYLGLYEWNVMPFGLSNAPGSFQSYLQNILGSMFYKNALVFIDDIIIYSKTEDEHWEHLKKVLQRIDDHNLRLNPKKCQVAMSEVNYLGFIINGVTIRPDPSKTQVVKDLTAPKNITDVQSFLGFCNYYRRFIKDYSKIAKPITELLKKESQFEWTTECQEAFETLKEKLISPPIVSHFIPGKEIILHTDASQVATGAVLTQVIDGKERVIYYYSRKLNAAERNYSTPEKELLAVKYAVQEFRHYLSLTDFTIWTDNTCVCAIKGYKDPHKRLFRLAIALSPFNFKIKFRSGRQHTDCDFLSRLYSVKNEDSLNDIMLLLAPTMEGIDLRKEQETDEECKAIMTELKIPESKTHKQYEIDDGILYKKTFNSIGHPIKLLYVPKTLRKRVFNELHSTQLSGHPGVNKMWADMASRFYWKNLAKDVVNWTKICHKCQEYKEEIGKPKGLMQLRDLPNSPFHTLSIDYAGPLIKTKKRNQYILVAICHYTKYMVAAPTKDQKSVTVANFIIDHIITKFGFPVNIITDNGKYFVSNFLKKFHEINEVNQITTIPWHPESNGIVERVIRTLKSMLRVYSELEKNWDELLNRVVFAYNRSIHSGTGETPYKRLFKVEPRLTIDIAMNTDKTRFNERYAQSLDLAEALVKIKVEKNREYQKKVFDKKRRDVKFKTGDIVLIKVKGGKTGQFQLFQPLYQGPFRIDKKINDVTYQLQWIEYPNRKFKKAHVERMKPWYATHPEKNEIGGQDSPQDPHGSSDLTELNNRKDVDDQSEDNASDDESRKSPASQLESEEEEEEENKSP